MMKKLLALSVLAFVAVAPSVQAQRSHRPVEFGVDAGVTFGLDDPNLTVVSIPVQDFRVGFLMSDDIALEPRMHLNSIHGDGGSITSYAFELGVVWTPGGDRVGKGLYGRPFLGVAGANITDFGSDNNGFAGLGVGLKIPFSDRRLATRMEANYTHGFGSGDSNAIALLIGLSFFTR